MKFHNKALSVLGTVAIGLGLTAGVAFADSTSSTGVSVSVLCSELSDVSVTGSGAFAPVDIALGETSTQTDANDLTVSVDSGCDLGPWHVDAEVSRFQSGIFSFAGDKFSLEAGPVTSFFNGSGLLVPKAPTANSAEFDPIPGFPIGDAGSDAPIFETTNILFFGFPTPFDYPAPFVSTASFTGHLDDLGGVPQGDYTSTLTVILVKD